MVANCDNWKVNILTNKQKIGSINYLPKVNADTHEKRHERFSKLMEHFMTLSLYLYCRLSPFYLGTTREENVGRDLDLSILVRQMHTVGSLKSQLVAPIYRRDVRIRSAIILSAVKAYQSFSCHIWY